MCTYSRKVKRELIKTPHNRQEGIVELSTMLVVGGIFVRYKTNNNLNIIISTENQIMAIKAFTLLEKTFNIKVECSIKRTSKTTRYTLVVLPSQESSKIMQACKILTEEDGSLRPTVNRILLRSKEDKRYFIKGCFIACGFLSDPAKNYHLEFILGHLQLAEQLSSILEDFNIEPKIIRRRLNYVVYFKEAIQIVNVLNVIMAHQTLFSFENSRLIKEVRNNINRVINFETANSQRTIKASVEQINNICFIRDTIGLNSLDPLLKEMALVRLDNSEATLQELGNLLSKPIGKSGVNHRLKKINKIAEDLRTRED